MKNIFLLHGALGTKTQFNSLKEKLATEFTVHTIDFEGHGEYASSNDFSMDSFATNVLDYLQANHIEKADIFGYSMGGYVALNLALKNPEVVGEIVTLGTKFNWTAETAAKEVKMLNPEKIEAKVPAFAKQLATIHSNNDWKTVLKKTAQMMLDLGNGKRLTTEDLKNISHQVLIGIGSKDHMVSLEESQKSAEALPNGTLQVFQDFPHPIEKVDEDELVKTIVNFIKT